MDDEVLLIFILCFVVLVLNGFGSDRQKELYDRTEIRIECSNNTCDTTYIYKR